MSGATDAPELSNLVADPETPEIPKGPGEFKITVEFKIRSKPTLSAVCSAAAIARDYKGNVWFHIGNDVYDARMVGEILESELMEKDEFSCTIEYDSTRISSLNGAKAAKHYIECAFGGERFTDAYRRETERKWIPSWSKPRL